MHDRFFRKILYLGIMFRTFCTGRNVNMRVDLSSGAVCHSVWIKQVTLVTIANLHSTVSMVFAVFFTKEVNKRIHRIPFTSSDSKPGAVITTQCKVHSHHIFVHFRVSIFSVLG